MKVVVVIEIPSIKDCDSPEADTVVDLASNLTKDITESFVGVGFKDANVWVDECFADEDSTGKKIAKAEAEQDDKWSDCPPACPECKSEDTIDTGFEEIAGEVAVIQCNDCGHEFHVEIDSAQFGDIVKEE